MFSSSHALWLAYCARLTEANSLAGPVALMSRSEEHTSELQSRLHLVCRLLLEKKTEDALVVNNCAAAIVLTLNTLAQRKEVLVSRGELVEIGGSFRIPDIMARSGARLVEVGTTNRTHDDDYRRAITPKTAAIVKVHRSNFAIEGFTADVSVERLVFIAAEHGLPVIHDLGSGLMVPLDEFGLSGEPTAASAIKSGATLVLMSGDKLLSGP